jgi:DNA-binding transcriptional ArsR family regulator
MAEERRREITDRAVLEALAHPIRLDILSFLMSRGQATASVCARAVGDNPSNSSYHLRVLARHGLVEPVDSTDRRERPWRALVTGISIEPTRAADDATVKALTGAFLQLDYQLAREALNRDDVDPSWRGAEAFSTYTLAVTPDELRTLVDGIDALLRPFMSATRDAPPVDAGIAYCSLTAFPRPSFG